MSARLHTCNHCGTRSYWDKSWSWYGSYRDFEDGKPIIKACSDSCMAALREKCSLPPEDEEEKPRKVKSQPIQYGVICPNCQDVAASDDSQDFKAGSLRCGNCGLFLEVEPC